MLLILGRSGTQYIAMVTKLLIANCGAHLVECYAKNQAFLIQIGWDIFFHYIWSKFGLSVWRHHLANLHILKTWISLEQKEVFKNSKQHFSSHSGYLFMFSNCGAHLVECYATNQAFLIQIGWDIFFHYIWSKFGLSVWRHHLANLHILKTWISLEQKEVFKNSKQHFSSHSGYLLMF